MSLTSKLKFVSRNSPNNKNILSHWLISALAWSIPENFFWHGFYSSIFSDYQWLRYVITLSSYNVWLIVQLRKQTLTQSFCCLPESNLLLSTLWLCWSKLANNISVRHHKWTIIVCPWYIVFCIPFSSDFCILFISIVTDY